MWEGGSSHPPPVTTTPPLLQMRGGASSRPLSVWKFSTQNCQKTGTVLNCTASKPVLPVPVLWNWECSISSSSRRWVPTKPVQNQYQLRYIRWYIKYGMLYIYSQESQLEPVIIFKSFPTSVTNHGWIFFSFNLCLKKKMPFSTSQYQYTSVQSWYQFYKVEKLPRTTQDHLELVFSGTSSSFTILELSSTGPGSSSVQKGQKTGTVLNFQTLVKNGL